MIYESILLFGIIFATGLFYGIATNQKNALSHKLGLQISVFLIMGLYFVWCWKSSGQTLAMKTWSLKLIKKDGQDITYVMAIKRYILCWIYMFLPTVLVYVVMHEVNFIIYVFMLNIILNILYMHFSKSKQFIYDKLLGLKIIRI